jgi:hypothetical protein
MTFSSELFLIVYFGFAGAALIAVIMPRLPRLWSAGVVLPIGILFSVISLGAAQFLFSLSEMLINVPVGLGLPLAFTIIFGGYRVGWRPYLSYFREHMFCATITLALIIFTRATWDPAFVLGDTLIQAERVKYILEYIPDSKNTSNLLGTWAYIYIYLNILVNWIGFLVFSFSPQIALYTTTIMTISLIVSISNTAPARLIILSFLTVVLYSSTPYFFLSASFLGSNVWLMVYLTIFMTVFISDSFHNGTGLFQKGNSHELLYSMCLLGIALSRVEGLLYCFFLFALIFLSGNYENKRLLRIFFIQIVPVFIIKIDTIVSIFFGEGAMISVNQLFIMLILYMMWIPYLLFIDSFLSRRWIEILFTAAVSVSAIVMMYTTRLNLEFGQSLSAVASNLFMQGLWGILPHIFVASLLVTTLVGRRRCIALAAQILCAICMMVIFLSLGRSPYYVDIGDSGHRIFGALIPAAVLIILAVIVDVVTPMAPKRPKED